MTESGGAKAYFDAAESDARFRGRTGPVAEAAYAEYVLEKLNAPQGAAVLDFGCGDGKILVAIKERRPDLACHGIDLSGGAIEKAQRHGAGIRGLTFDRADVLENAGTLGEYDRIFSFSVLQYVPAGRLGRLFAILGDHLREGGEMWHCSVPDLRKRWLLFADDALNGPGGCPPGDGVKALHLYAVHLWRLLRGDRRFGEDGISRFHDARELAESAGAALSCEIFRPSDSWYRFDARLVKR